MLIRGEHANDIGRIRELVRRAFAQAPHGSGTEWAIVDGLRRAGALTLSLVAIGGRDLVGHVAVSPVDLGGAQGWFGLGPVAVDPARQRQGIGSALVGEALDRLRSAGAAGCVVLGEPSFYGRFGFVHDPRLGYRDAPPPYFQSIRFSDSGATGEVDYHPAFDAEG